jgi:ribulose-5-phosphate 4-epimerase/fuculose-1-phosphate aldolase
MEDARQTALDDLVVANHILFQQGVLDAYGHVSVRDPQDPTRFFSARHMAPGIVAASDIQTLDLEGKVVDGPNERSYTERFIHAAVYAARPDVNGVVHTHSHSIIPFGATKAELKPLWAPAAFLGRGVVKFDTREIRGNLDIMIRTLPQGKALAKRIGKNVVVLMRGHGATVVGTSLREAIYRAVYLEANAKIQMEAMRFGKPVFMNRGEVRRLEEHHASDPSYRRTWEFWKSLTEG